MRLVDLLYFLFFFLFYLSIPFWIPAAIGLYLLTSRQNALGRLAGFLTLKPIIATPIWVGILSLLHASAVDAQSIALWSVLPGASLTFLALVIFRRLFLSLSPRFILAVFLILLDCLRWINSGLLTFTASLPYNRTTDTFTGIFALIGLIFPTAYAVIALTITMLTHEHGTTDRLQSGKNVNLSPKGP